MGREYGSDGGQVDRRLAHARPSPPHVAFALDLPPMQTLCSYVAGAWVAGKGKPATLVNPSTEEPLAEASSEGVDFGMAVRFARETGGAALRALTFAQRGELLAKL